MNLIVDIGNTLIKCFVVEDGNIVYSQKSEHVSVDFFKGLLDTYQEVDKGICVSTGTENHEVKSFLSTRLDCFIELSHTTPVPIRNLYETPQTLGSDRLAGAVGASCLFPHDNVIVFDFGTAITIDFIQNNCFLGGNISPGLQTRFRALQYFTQRLPLCAASDQELLMGRNTKEAIEAGVQIGILAEVESYLSRYKEYKVLFTGGDAFYFAKKIKSPIFVVRNLIVVGLNAIVEYNQGLK